MNSIPKIIHLTCKDKEVPEQYKSFFKTVCELHPAWEVKVYDDEACVGFVKNYLPSFLSLYEKLALPIQRADLFRILIVYHYGGFYMDFDMQILKPLDTLCTNTLVLAEEHIFSKRECAWRNKKYPVQIANYMFASVARHPFWLNYIDAIIQNAEKPILHESDVLITTGPELLTSVYYEMRSQYVNITLLQNRDKKCLVNCRDASCHFGKYAAHMHMGSWRWQRRK